MKTIVTQKFEHYQPSHAFDSSNSTLKIFIAKFLYWYGLQGYITDRSCMLHVAYCMLHTVWCMLYVVYSKLYVAHCMLCVVCCLLYAVCWMLHTESCMCSLIGSSCISSRQSSKIIWDMKHSGVQSYLGIIHVKACGWCSKGSGCIGEHSKNKRFRPSWNWRSNTIYAKTMLIYKIPQVFVILTYRQALVEWPSRQ